jgi:hypothetical protein
MFSIKTHQHQVRLLGGAAKHHRCCPHEVSYLNGEERVSGSREDAEREDGVARAAHSSLLTITMLPTGSGVSKMRSQERLVDAGEKAQQGLSK